MNLDTHEATTVPFGLTPDIAWVTTRAGETFRQVSELLAGHAGDPESHVLALLVVLLALGLLVRMVTRRKRSASQGRRSTDNDPASTPPKCGEELAHALRASRTALVGVAVFSAFANILMLTGAMFMLLVYDRVLTSRSVPTLVGLAVLVGILYAVQALLEFARSRVLVRVGASMDEALGPRLFQLVARMPLVTGSREAGLQAVRDMDAIRSFLSGPGIVALFDMPWLPFYLGVIYLFHPVLGLVATAGALVILVMAVTAELLSRRPARAAAGEAQRRASIAEASQRNAEVLLSMGMTAALSRRFLAASRDHALERMRASDVSGGLGSFSKTFRLLLQSAMIGIGAYLAINGEASAGIIIAGSIIAGRALAPVDQAIGQWKNIVYARQGWHRLSDALADFPVERQRLRLPPPRNRLDLQGVCVAEPGGPRLLVRDVGFCLTAGQGVGIIGPSGSGKTTLARALVGAWKPVAGRIRLDGADLDQWPEGEIGPHLGYLPQDVELFEGTIAENIARFDSGASPEKIITAAKAAGVHELILNYRDGYETQIGEGGARLSAGQRQRIGLARALYGDPFMVVLDEPNANLDTEGDKSLMGGVEQVRQRGGIVVLVSHRPSALACIDHVMIMQDGRIVAFGKRDETLEKFYPALNVGGTPRKRIREPERASLRIVRGDTAASSNVAADAKVPEVETGEAGT